jgi:hypothetical protein
MQVLLEAGDPEAKTVWSPLVAADGQVSRLPPELQPYHLHMKAALAIR